MRLLLDECLPRVFAQELLGHDVQTAQQAGFDGIKNGELLKRIAAAGFHAFEKMEELLVFLGSPNRSWTFEGGSVGFVDDQSLERFNVLTAELQAIGTERERLQRAAEAQRNSLAEGGP